jgi:hypothetical protein
MTLSAVTTVLMYEARAVSYKDLSDSKRTRAPCEVQNVRARQHLAPETDAVCLEQHLLRKIGIAPAIRRHGGCPTEHRDKVIPAQTAHRPKTGQPFTGFQLAGLTSA